MALSTLTSKGQLTLPKSIRDFLKIDVGDKVEFIVDEQGQVIVRAKVLQVDDIFGMIDSKKKGVTVEDMNSAIDKTMRKKGKNSARD